MKSTTDSIWTNLSNKRSSKHVFLCHLIIPIFKKQVSRCVHVIDIDRCLQRYVNWNALWYLFFIVCQPDVDMCKFTIYNKTPDTAHLLF